MPAPPAPAVEAARRWLSIHDEVAPGLIEGLYLVGSAGLGDWRLGSDLDIVAFSADAASDEDAERLRAAHDAAATAIGVSVDGPRLAWADVTVPPLPLHRPWSLDGVFHHDGDCFEINPITWFTLAEHGVSVRGDRPERLDIAVDTDDRRSFVRENTDTYWRSIGRMIADALADPDRAEFRADTTEWCALGVARMLYTFETGGVASKSTAGEWAAERLPGHEPVIRAALRIRSTDDPQPVGRDVAAATLAFVQQVVDLIAMRPA